MGSEKHVGALLLLRECREDESSKEYMKKQRCANIHRIERASFTSHLSYFGIDLEVSFAACNEPGSSSIPSTPRNKNLLKWPALGLFHELWCRSTCIHCSSYSAFLSVVTPLARLTSRRINDG